MLGGRFGQPKGFTLVDLLCTIGVLVILFVVVVPWMGKASNAARQAACQANLSAIGKSIVMYSGLSNDAQPFPLLRASGDPNAPVNAGTVADDIWSADLGSNGMQNVWLLVKENLIGQAAFHCPSDEQWQQRASTAKYGWAGLAEFSYGVHYPYRSDASDSPNPASLGPDPEHPGSGPAVPEGLVMFADRNPGGPVTSDRPSSNHRQSDIRDGSQITPGQAVLMRDVSVTFKKDSNCGVGGDDIYTNAKGLAGGIPVNDKDTSITPVPSR